MIPHQHDFQNDPNKKIIVSRLGHGMIKVEEAGGDHTLGQFNS